MDLRKVEKDIAKRVGLPGKRRVIQIETVREANRRKFNAAPLPTYRGSFSVKKK